MDHHRPQGQQPASPTTGFAVTPTQRHPSVSVQMTDVTGRPDTAITQVIEATPKPSSAEKLEYADSISDKYAVANNGRPMPLPRLPVTARPEEGQQRVRTIDGHVSMGRGTEVDWIIPVDEKMIRRYTVRERLQPTVETARNERIKYATKAKMTGYALNAAIGLQVLLGSLTTGLSAVTSGRQTAVMTTVLGALSTIVASYLARARGSNEPELSITRVKDLEHFIRECEAFQLDHGHVTGNEFDDELNGFRNEFEALLGNANGERRLSPPV